MGQEIYLESRQSNIVFMANLTAYFVFILVFSQTGVPLCGWIFLTKCCMTTMSWTMETSGLLTSATARLIRSPRRRGREAGRSTATVHMESMYSLKVYKQKASFRIDSENLFDKWSVALHCSDITLM